jgi:hypothetical protein
MIGAESLTPATPPAPMMGIARFRANFPGAYQQTSGGPLIAPSGDIQTFNEPEPMQGGMKAADLKQAMAAVQAAMRFQGARGLSEDLQRGIPPDQALLRNGSKMFYNAPQAFAATMAKMGLGNVGGTGGPLQLRPVIGPDGQPVTGVGAASGAGGSVHIVETNKAEQQKAKQAAIDAKAAQGVMQKALAAAIKDRDNTAPKSPQFAAKQAAVAALRAKLAGGVDASVKVRKWNHDKGDFE